jgi:hypothetical protein
LKTTPLRCFQRWQKQRRRRVEPVRGGTEAGSAQLENSALISHNQFHQTELFNHLRGFMQR